MGTMYDAVNAANIPANAEIVAGYINGKYAWSEGDWARFPNASKVRILVYIPGMAVIVNDGDVLDVEAGDASHRDAQTYAAQWVQTRLDSGVFPTIYTSKSGLQYLGGLPCGFWIADPTKAPHLLPGTVATQYDWHPGYDVSMTADGWPRTASPTTPEGHTLPNSPCAGFKRTASSKGYWMVGRDGGVFTFGDAGFFGSLGSEHLNASIIGIEPTITEKGYWLFAEDYGVFAFGDADYLGHPGA